MMPVNSSEAFTGGNGAVVVGNGAATIPAGATVVAITALAAGNITTTGGTHGALSAVPVPAGVTIFGRWTAVTGSVGNQAIAYLG